MGQIIVICLACMLIADQVEITLWEIKRDRMLAENRTRRRYQ